jgi:hypothetical protein
MNNEIEINEIIFKYEKMFIDNYYRRNSIKLNDLLDDKFYEIGSSGKEYNKENVLIELQKAPIVNLEIVDFDVKMLSSAVALAIFKIMNINEDGTKVANSLRSSIWKNVDGEWKLFFHQGTKCV